MASRLLPCALSVTTLQTHNHTRHRPTHTRIIHTHSRTHTGALALTPVSLCILVSLSLSTSHLASPPLPSSRGRPSHPRLRFSCFCAAIWEARSSRMLYVCNRRSACTRARRFSTLRTQTTSVQSPGHEQSSRGHTCTPLIHSVSIARPLCFYTWHTRVYDGSLCGY